MHITHVIGSLDPVTGGPPVVVRGLAKAQAQLEHQIRVVTQSNGSEMDLPGSSRIEVVRLAESQRLRDFVYLPGNELLEKTVAAADVVHLHGVWCPIVMRGAHAAQRMGKPYLITPHGMLDPWPMSQKHWRKKIMMALACRRMLNRAATIIALSQEEAGHIRAWGITIPVEVVPNGIELDQVKSIPGSVQFRRQVPGLGDQPYVLFLSRLHFKKGLDYLADAFALVARENRQVRLVVAGPDEGEQQKFERLIRSAGLQERVHVIGPVYGADKFAAMAEADCFVLPSRHENFGLVAIEPLAVGTPVIISDQVQISSEIAAAGAGLVVPLEPQRIAEAMAKLLADAALRQKMGSAGRDFVLKRYAWPLIAQTTIGLYERAIAVL